MVERLLVGRNLSQKIIDVNSLRYCSCFLIIITNSHNHQEPFWSRKIPLTKFVEAHHHELLGHPTSINVYEHTLLDEEMNAMLVDFRDCSRESREFPYCNKATLYDLLLPPRRSRIPMSKCLQSTSKVMPSLTRRYGKKAYDLKSS